ncbi:MAG: two-component system, OmpR family, phosphate regulon sensor histidine kinase PhoR [Halanaerobiales bacterium]|nr:two-component system, OmpR family, phosphate regulon sensor histidine kinase PhoR [Halanaerobiales bacterium]
MLNWNNLSLRKQFLLLFIFIQVLVLVGLMLYLNHNEREFYLNQLKRNLVHESRLILDNEKLDLTRPPAELDSWIKELGDKIDKRITVITREGLVIADSAYDPAEMDNHINRPEINEVLEGNKTGLSIRRSKTLEKEMFYLTLPIKVQGEIVGFIRLSKSLRDINSVIRKNIINYLIFLFITLIITLLLLWKFSKDIINPLNQVANLAGKLARGNFQERINLKNYKNEIGTLARMFNFMAAQLENKINEISEEKNRAEAILTSMVDGLIATDRDKKIRIINPAARKMFAIEEKEIKGKELIEVVRHHEIDRFLENSLLNNQVLSEEIVIQKDEKRIFRCNFAPITNERDQVIGGIIVLNDISELRRLEQVRTEFVANVSHELRTPLTSIIGYIDTIMENEIQDPSTIDRFLRIIKTEADRLALLIRDLLDLSRLEGKNRQPELYPSDLQKLIKKTSLILGDKAEEKDIHLKTEVEDDLPPVKMVPEQIELALTNLIDNGIKYTPEGGEVIIRAFTNQNRVIVEVEDNGIGIPEEEQERIFERFYRVDKARSRALGGTGIGLSIVKHIIKNHQSEIEVESMPGEGSVFRFYLQVAR